MITFRKLLVLMSSIYLIFVQSGFQNITRFVNPIKIHKGFTSKPCDKMDFPGNMHHKYLL